ncbi:MAG: NADH-quinone oxidoreductase subunit L, partial [Deltaproteobacteria bacterium]|nr:NADH-quinone oxidoreductase subunit L [Deltaproteobacteria bacterium]
MKIPMICLVLAGASLSGLPPLAGFFSKEAILATLSDLKNPFWLIAGFLGLFLTPYYTFRPIFIILFPQKIDRQDLYEKRPGNRLYWTMTIPLIILAAFILTAGFIEPLLKDFLSDQPTAGEKRGWITYVSLALVLSAVALAWIEFGRKESPRLGLAERLPRLRDFLAERWYLDHFYRIILNLVIYRTFADPFTRTDQQIIDGGLDRFCKFTVESGRLVSYLQSGRL